MANIQIPDELFLRLIEFFLLGDHNQDAFEEIAAMVDAKCQKMIKRNLYSKQFDPNLSQRDREAARQEYLDLIGMHRHYRYSSKDRL